MRELEVIAVKKTLVTILIVLVLVVALGIAGAVGFMWYRNNHVFVDGDAYDITLQSLDLTEEDVSVQYYDELREKLTDSEKYGWSIHTVRGVGYKFEVKE